MNLKVQEQFEVRSYETDVFRRLKPFFLQTHVQEMAYKGSEFCGAGYELLRSQGFFWALNRLHLHILDWPLWGEEVVLQTWSRAKAGPLWHRNFKMFRPGAEDSPLMLGTSAWTMLNIADRSICREDNGFNQAYHLAEDTLPFCGKIVIPAETVMEDAGSHTVAFSDLDSNAHANNCMYTQWAVDTLPLDYLTTHELRDLQICYYRELHYGETVHFRLGGTQSKRYLQGMAGDTVCFVVEMEFAPLPGQPLTA